MGLITAVRSQMPVVPGPAPQPPEATSRQLVETAAPVSEPQRKNAVPQPGVAAAAVTARLAERDESDHPVPEARIAAEAAREAYIRASIAAGVSPLPLPGA
jgi:hypothetical protein